MPIYYCVCPSPVPGPEFQEQKRNGPKIYLEQIKK